MMKTKKIEMPSIAFIIARSYPQYVIGCENKLPWRLKTDMKFFRRVTEGHAVIMGRKTFESIGMPLPNRMNIVLSRQAGNSANNLMWVTERESALFFADIYSILQGKKQIMVIGGAEIYRHMSDLVNKIYLTEVFATIDHGDAHFGLEFDFRKWRTLEENEYPQSADDEYPFRISVIERRLKKVRQRELSEFLTEDPQVTKWAETAKISQKVQAFPGLPDEQIPLPLIAA